MKFDKLPENSLEYPYKVYFSACVRGPNGDKATPEEKLINIERGKTLATSLKMKFPNWSLYVPHEHELFIELAWEMKLITSEAIMKVFCKMVQQRDIIVAVEEDVELSAGVRLELKAARKAKKIVLSYERIMGI